MPEINPLPGDYCTPQDVTPRRRTPTLDVHTPEITPWVDTESADGDRRRSCRYIYSPPPPAPYIKKFAADTECRLQPYYALPTNCSAMPAVVSDQSGMSDLLKS